MALYPLLPDPSPQFCDANGNPYVAGTLDTFVVATTTPKDTWRDPAGAALNTNPIVLDSAGRCVMHGDGNYRLVLKDALGNLIFDLPSSTLVSAAMAPVIAAPTIADALVLLGVQDTIDTAVAVETTRAEAAETAEAATRAAADTAEATARATADATLTAGLAAEIARAEAAEAALSAAIGAIPSVSGVGSFHAGRATSDGSGAFNVGWSPPFGTACISFQVYAVYPTGGLDIWPEPSLSCWTYADAGRTVAGPGTVSQTWGRLFVGDTARHALDDPGLEVTAPSTDFYWLAFGV
jgi:hypothetical protein